VITCLSISISVFIPPHPPNLRLPRSGPLSFFSAQADFCLILAAGRVVAGLGVGLVSALGMFSIAENFPHLPSANMISPQSTSLSI